MTEKKLGVKVDFWYVRPPWSNP